MVVKNTPDARSARTQTLRMPALAPPAGTSPVVCAWCERVRVAPGTWLPAVLVAPTTSHGICPTCLEERFPPEQPFEPARV